MYQWCELYGVFRNVANSRAVVTLFGGDWLQFGMASGWERGEVSVVVESLKKVSMECIIGGLPKCPKFGCSGDTF